MDAKALAQAAVKFAVLALAFSLCESKTGMRYILALLLFRYSKGQLPILSAAKQLFSLGILPLISRQTRPPAASWRTSK